MRPPVFFFNTRESADNFLDRTGISQPSFVVDKCLGLDLPLGMLASRPVHAVDLVYSDWICPQVLCRRHSTNSRADLSPFRLLAQYSSEFQIQPHMTQVMCF